MGNELDEIFVKEKINPIVGYIFHSAKELGKMNAPNETDWKYLREGTERIKQLLSTRPEPMAALVKAREALAHYADAANWRCSQEYEAGHRCSNTQISSCDARKYTDDNGYDIAREALAAIGANDGP